MAKKITADMRRWQELTQKLREAPSALGPILQGKIGTAADGIVREAERLTEYSVRIPIAVSALTAKGARITTTGGGASKTDDIGAVIENAGKGNVRHPVYERSVAAGGGGRWYGRQGHAPKAGLSRRGGIAPWTSKNSHPEFMYAARRARNAQSYDLITSSLQEALREVDL